MTASKSSKSSKANANPQTKPRTRKKRAHPSPNGNGHVLPLPLPLPSAAVAVTVAGGRLASSIQRLEPQWFLPALIPAECLSFVVGDPSTGKSTFGAMLCASAKRPAIMPGYEESVECAMVPRLVTNEVDLDNTLVMDERAWIFPQDRQALTEILSARGTDLLWIDPIDSYVSMRGENEPQEVRAALESICRLARDARVTVVAARHPGKEAGNICPGSRQWRAVPREIVELQIDDGPPERRILRLRKDPFNQQPGPRVFTLEGQPGRPKRLQLAEVIDAVVADTLGVGDKMEKAMIAEAADLLRALLADNEQEWTWVLAEGRKHGFTERTLRYAADRIGVKKRREGHGREHRSIWFLSES